MLHYQNLVYQETIIITRINEELEDSSLDCNTIVTIIPIIYFQLTDIKPTSLTQTDLWTNPDLKASFLDLDNTRLS